MAAKYDNNNTHTHKTGGKCNARRQAIERDDDTGGGDNDDGGDDVGDGSSVKTHHNNNTGNIVITLRQSHTSRKMILL